MSGHDAFERILASLYEAMLDETHWPATSALIDEACGITGNDLMVGEGPTDDVRARFVGAYRVCGGLAGRSTTGGSAAKTWSASTSSTTTPPTNGCRASGTCPTVVWRTSPSCTRPRS